MRELNELLGIKTKLLIAFHPQTDGQTERMNQELEQYFRMFINHHQEQWLEWLGTAEFAYNNKVYTGTKVLLFKANNGQHPRIGFEARKKGRYEGAERFVERIKEIQGEAKAALAKAQDNMKKYQIGIGRRQCFELADSKECQGYAKVHGTCQLLQTVYSGLQQSDKATEHISRKG